MFLAGNKISSYKTIENNYYIFRGDSLSSSLFLLTQSLTHSGNLSKFSHMSAICQQQVSNMSATYLQRVSQMSDKCQAHVSHLSATYQPIVSHVSAKCKPCVSCK
jgi:hypothetical protein